MTLQIIRYLVDMHLEEAVGKPYKEPGDQGATVNVNNANEAGAYRRNTNTGAVAVHFIKFL